MKKKILGVALVVCILVLSVASVTMAYFTDEKAMTNTFTVGNVAIKLDENVVKQDETNGNYVANGTARTEQGFDIPTSLFPMQNISKDPTITNTGSEDAFFGAVITIKNGAEADANADVASMLKIADDETGVNDKAVNISAFLVNLVSNGATVTYEKANGDLTITIVFNDAKETDDSVTLFTSVQIASAWNNTEMANLADLEIVVNAYAVQTAGFANAAEALAAAFPNVF